MNFRLSSFLFIISTFSSITNSTLIPPLLSLGCTPSPSTHHHHSINPIKTLLDNLTSVALNSRFTTFNTTFRQEWYSGLMQCRPGLRPKACTLCASAARNTILNLCPNSNAVSVWYDGCYVQISMMIMNSSHDHDHDAHMDVSNHSCSNRTKNQDPARSAPALEALLLKLRADVDLATHHGFSQGEIVYDNINHSDSRIYGIVECVRSLSPQECDFCVRKATEKLQFYCGGKNGGTAVYGPCLVHFDSNEFYYEGIHSAAAGGGNFTVWEGENGGIKRGLVIGYLGGGVACFLVFVLLAFLLRRTVVNIAKVGTLA
ncbi:cysteine-rich repeat secretory protein 38 [Sesamum indicum]|uniref:Cysteine-rich repeat secretory protein 38 n=1 Tax=Sesamum indicum TaxID=4182 RepID=A0A6I9SZ03_SESIN|nr:cysteine-rich repeat secretory protein 38 [Sesamum indicum]